MHVLVTGGAGFIGSHLVEYHLNQGDKVHAVDNLNTGSINNIQNFTKNPDFRFTEADILNWKDLSKTVEWADRIYHMAAIVGMFKVLEDPTRVLAVNIAGTERILSTAQSSNWDPQILIASTSEVYGAKKDTFFQEDEELTFCSGGCSRWTYAISKLVDEIAGHSYFRKYDMNITMVRLFNTIGPRQTGEYGMVVPRFVDRAVAGKPIAIYGTGTQTRSFCDVRDTVHALSLIAGNPACRGEVLNVGNDYEISILGLAEMIKELASSNSPIEFLSYDEAYGKNFVDVPRRKPNLEKFYRFIDFKHTLTLEDTLKQLISLAFEKNNIH